MTDLDPDTLDSIEADLRDAVGKANAITSGELARRHVPGDSEANPTTREAVKEIMMRERGLPIVSCGNGYYLPADRGTIDDELDSLRGRIAGIEDRMALLESNWQQWRATTDGGDVVDTYSPHDDEDTDSDEPPSDEQADRTPRQWADMTEAEREQVRDDPILSPADFNGGNA